MTLAVKNETIHKAEVTQGWEGSHIYNYFSILDIGKGSGYLFNVFLRCAEISF